jgi:hypothetical protein
MNLPLKSQKSDYNYNSVLSFKKGKYFFYIKELQVLGSGDGVNSAYQDMLLKKDTLIKEFDEGENLNQLPKPNNKSSRSFYDDLIQLRLFGLKLLVLSLVGILVFSFADDKMGKTLDPTIQGIKNKIRVSKLGEFLLVQLDDAVTHKISPEAEKRIIQNIRIIVKRLKPYANELKPLLRVNDNETQLNKN